MKWCLLIRSLSHSCVCSQQLPRTIQRLLKYCLVDFPHHSRSLGHTTAVVSRHEFGVPPRYVRVLDPDHFCIVGKNDLMVEVPFSLQSCSLSNTTWHRCWSVPGLDVLDFSSRDVQLDTPFQPQGAKSWHLKKVILTWSVMAVIKYSHVILHAIVQLPDTTG